MEMKAQPVNSRAVGKEKVRPGACSTTLAPQRVTYATYFGPFRRSHRRFIARATAEGTRRPLQIACTTTCVMAAGFGLRAARPGDCQGPHVRCKREVVGTTSATHPS